MVEKIHEGIVPLVIVTRCLGIGVFNVYERIADRTAEVAIPVVVEKRDDTQNRQGDSLDWLERIRKVVLHADIDWCIVHIVLNASTVNDRKSPNVILREIETRRYVDSPPEGVAAEVKLWIGCGIHP